DARRAAWPRRQRAVPAPARRRRSLPALPALRLSAQQQRARLAHHEERARDEHEVARPAEVARQRQGGGDVRRLVHLLGRPRPPGGRRHVGRGGGAGPRRARPTSGPSTPATSLSADTPTTRTVAAPPRSSRAAASAAAASGLWAPSRTQARSRSRRSRRPGQPVAATAALTCSAPT